MIIRKVRASDISEMYQKFKEVSVTAEDIKKGKRPISGFYEYPLSYQEFERRALSPLSLVCVNNGRVVSYLLSFPISEIRKMLREGYEDPVFKRISGLDSEVIYFDQLLVERGLPANVFAARVLQTGDKLAQNIGSPGVIGATAERPWSNIASKKLIRFSGFLKQEELPQTNFTLGIYTKPYWKLDTPFEGFGDRLVIPN